MEQELKDLCDLLFPSSSDNVEYYAEILDYIKKLGSQNWEHIQKEPERLKEEMRHLTEQTQDLAFTNYKTFVETADISRTITKDLVQSKESLGQFLKAAPAFVEQCENFSQVAGNILQDKNQSTQQTGGALKRVGRDKDQPAKRRKYTDSDASTSRTVEVDQVTEDNDGDRINCSTCQVLIKKRRYSNIRNQSEKLLELLELPSLMREALNSEDYECALDIFTFIRNLSKRYAEIPIVQNTTNEIMTLWFETLYHLFNQLHYDLPLPQCLQILGYLRRANTVFKSTEDENIHPMGLKSQNTDMSDGLALHFLKARNAWFENALEEAKSTETTDKLLRKLVELHRVHLFNVITQHKSIFLSDTQDSNMRDDELNGNSALSCWLKEKVEELAQLLNQDLWKEDETGFESIFNQCMYLCLSFGRVGADFRCVLTPLFRNNILTQFHTGIEKVNNQFENTMKVYKVPSIKNVPRPTSESTASGPPENLLDYYPLAELCNGLLGLLNSLRLTAPLNIVKDVYNSFRDFFEKAAQILAAFYHKEQQAYSDIERENFVSFCVCFSEDLVPYITKCLSQSFPPTQIAELLGITLSTLQDSKILHLDQHGISQPLRPIIGNNLID